MFDLYYTLKTVITQGAFSVIAREPSAVVILSAAKDPFPVIFDFLSVFLRFDF